MKNKIISDAAANYLLPIIEFAAANRGTITRIKRQFDILTGTTTCRENFERWLSTDPGKRIQPQLGTGLLIHRIGSEIIRSRIN